MGVYSNDRLGMSGAGIDTLVTANESYKGDVGLQQILIESAQNDMAIFDAVIRSDINEAVSLQEGTLLQEEVAIMHEGMVKDFFGKVLAFLKKMVEKIKGIFKAIYAKITGVVVRDGKKLVDMHKKNVIGKNLSKMKYKWAQPTGKSLDLASDILDTKDLKDNDSKEEISKTVNDWQDDDNELNRLLGASMGGNTTTDSEYAKDAHDHMFDEAEDVEGCGNITDIMSQILNTDKMLKDLKKIERDFTTAANKKNTNLEKQSREATKSISAKAGAGDNAESERLVALANAQLSYLTIAQNATTKIIAAQTAAIKFENAQCRALWTKAAYFDPKAVKESALLEDMAYETAFTEGCELFENFEY